ncbi:MAG: hypothetical protein HOQ43_01700 [Glycomyces artemisiae]|uniref:JAB domain-containing protein n=1 Tax=Glycomyces artemisiae TaxID=1076443 RepID=A0A850BZ45_9ACTN|nr:hypothetical protein [Glycomyces artemisiae]
MDARRALIRIYSSEIECIADETADHADIETGGSLFGLWSDGGNPTIHLATRPGPNAERHVSQFAQDPDFHWVLEQLVMHHFGIQSVGLWHSHHRLGLHELSGGDLRRARDFSRRSGRTKFSDILTYFDTHQASDRPREVCVKPHVYADATAGLQLPTQFQVIQGTSPFRAALQRLLPREYRSAFDRPRRQRPHLRLETSMAQEDRYAEDVARAVPETAPRAALSSAPETPRPLEPEPAGPPRDGTAEPEPAPSVEEQRASVFEQIQHRIEEMVTRLEIPAGVYCEVVRFHDYGTLVFRMDAPSIGIVQDIELAMSDGDLVAVRHSVRDVRSRDPQELIVTKTRNAEESLRKAIASFRKFRS